ncbi:MAG TPA: long-chain fatty acid--CoA ligase [Anaerolineae bacterium]|nr:long-chain fatty acid--CoA ligase [Anaerolineae bacterium]
MFPDFRWFAHYEPDVAHSVDIPDSTVQQVLLDAAARFPNHTALRMVLRYLPLGLKVQARLSYAELNRLSDRFAAALAQLGVAKGDRVSLMLPNIPQLAIAYFGVLKAGAVVVNTNPTYPAHELAPLLRNAGAETIVTLSGLYPRVLEIQPNTALKTVILADIPDSIGRPFHNSVAKQARASGLMKEVTLGAGAHFMRDLLAAAPSHPPVVSIDPASDTAVFQFTGGTSGLPKAAELTHRNLVANIAQINAWVPSLQPGAEKFLLALPAFHVYGMTVGMLTCLKLGGELLLAADPRNTLHLMQIIAREKVTVYPGVPAMYIAILNHSRVSEFDLHSIRVCLSGGAALPAEVAQQFEQMTGGKLVEGYGMSESSPLTAGNPVFGRTKIGTVGMPFPSTELAVVALEADEQGKPRFLEVGEAGELVVRGPQVMKGYYNNPEETASAIDVDGWLHTGDIAVMDADGYFSIVDRKKDLIIASGFNIVPREVEEVLFTHPAVLEAAVVGVSDAKRGETVKAFVVLKEGQRATVEELRAFCKERLAPYKVPTLVEFRTELPKSQVGKTLRRILVEEEKQKQVA